MSETDKLVERLDRPSTPEGFEEIMKAWDRIRHVLQVEKNRGSYPRDMFETLIDGLAQDMRQAATALRSAEARIRELEGQVAEAGAYTEAHERLDDLARERVAAAEAQVARAREVVAPFAAVAEMMRPLGAFENWPDDTEPSTFVPHAWPVWRAFKAAAAFLASMQ